MLAGLRAFGNDPARAFLHAHLAQQKRKRHAGPDAATGQSMCVLNGSRRHLSRFTGDACRGAIPMAFKEMQPRYRGQPLDLIEAEDQGPVHHPMNHHAMLAGIDVRWFVPVGDDEVQRGWGNDSDGILKGRAEPVVTPRARYDGP